MRPFKQGCILLFAIVGFVAVGCGDPVRTTLQQIVLKISYSNTNIPISNVVVAIKYDIDYYEPDTDEWNEWKKASNKWITGITNYDGKATVDIIVTALDRTIGPTPPSWRDFVTGTAYLISVKKDQVHEEIRLIMQPGASVRGKLFTVKVLEIQRPRYIKTNW